MRYFAILISLTLLTFGVQQIAAAPKAGATAQTTAPAAASLPPLTLPADTAILAKLSTELNGSQCKRGDVLEAEAKQDVKQGHDVVLKKGTMLVGHVAGVQPASSGKGLSIAITFDTAKMKDGKQFSVRMGIKALAPEANITNNDTLNDGRGMDAAANNATTSGHSTTLRGNFGQLNAASAGVYDIPGLDLATQLTDGVRYSLLISSTANFRLKKGTQVVLKVIEQ
jgi:hypothetical protein